MKNTEGKKPSESFTVMNDLVLPNYFGNLLGGCLIYLIGIAIGMPTGKHGNLPSRAAGVYNLSLKVLFIKEHFFEPSLCADQIK